ncbi:hypothetical protein Tco_0328912 [Tanacetum coccineum]
MSKRTRTRKSTKGQSSRSQEPTMEDKVREFGVFDSDVHQGNHFVVLKCPIHPGDVIDWEFLSTHGLAREYNSAHEESRLDDTRRGLNNGETVRVQVLRMGFWPSTGDGEFVVGGTSIKKVRDPKVRLAHRCIGTTISGRKESTHRITINDIFFLYCIYGEGVTCSIPYWLAQYLKGVRDTDLTCGGMFVTRIARSFGLLTNAMLDALSVESRAHIFKKKSLIAMNFVMDLHRGACCWPATRPVVEDDEVEETANQEAAASVEVYRNMSQSDWQIDPFSGREADYPPYGYTGYMPPGYEYRFGLASDGFE